MAQGLPLAFGINPCMSCLVVVYMFVLEQQRGSVSDAEASVKETGHHKTAQEQHPITSLKPCEPNHISTGVDENSCADSTRLSAHANDVKASGSTAQSHVVLAPRDTNANVRNK